MHEKQENVFCHNHPNQVAAHINENGTVRLCNKCFIMMSKNEADYDE
jgi:hypothetical protein